jgi:hypothetical protein
LLHWAKDPKRDNDHTGKCPGEGMVSYHVVQFVSLEFDLEQEPNYAENMFLVGQKVKDLPHTGKKYLIHPQKVFTGGGQKVASFLSMFEISILLPVACTHN